MMRNFIVGQFNQIKKNPWRTLLQKIGRLILFIFAIPIMMMVRLLRPWFLIRFGELPSTRIGPFAMCPELYLCERDKGLQPRSLDLFYCSDERIANTYLKKMWKRLLYIYDAVKVLIRVNKLLPGYKKHYIELPHEYEHDYRGLLASTSRHIYFTDEEKKKGEQFLKEKGVAGSGARAGHKFICFASRDSAYLNAVRPDNNWNYHNYRDFSIYHTLPAAQELTQRGYTLFRMGSIVAETLKTENPKIIDYATQCRNEFLDLFLLGNCHFYLGALSGLNSVSMAFRVPKAVINAVPLMTAHTWMPHDLYIPKKIWHRKEGRFLTFAEMLDPTVGGFQHGERYDKHNLEVINNTAEEIIALSIEMDERLKGSWQTTDEDEELQKQLADIFRKKTCHQKIFARMGRDFLRQNQSLLDFSLTKTG